MPNASTPISIDDFGSAFRINFKMAAPAAPGRRRPHLQLPHELNQIVLFLRSEFEFQDQVEELHRVLQCQKPAVMEIRWAVFDTPQRERLNRSISCFVF